MASRAPQPDLDHSPVAPAGSIDRVPVIDLRHDPAEVIGQVAAACRDWGFFQVVGHGVPDGARDTVLAAARAYFARPAAAKRRYLRSRDNPWGYYDRERTKTKRDRKEIFDIGPDAGGADAAGAPFAGSTPWPDDPPDFAAVMRDWFERMTQLSARLTGLIAAGLTGDAERLRGAFEPGHSSFLRLNFYPLGDPLAGESDESAGLGIHHHTDAGALTALLQDSVGGLQVHRDGLWHDVVPVPGAFTVNIGDMIQVWSNDLYRAPVHRVLAMDRAERLSIPYFYNPGYGADIAPLAGPPHYRPINWGEFRRRRADGDFADYGTEVQIADYRLD